MDETHAALINLYNASRLAPLTADQHNHLLQCFELLKMMLTTKNEKQ